MVICFTGLRVIVTNLNPVIYIYIYIYIYICMSPHPI